MTQAAAQARPPQLTVMARAPVAGAVKTRLEPLLGAEGCARLQAALIRRTVALGARFVAHTGPAGMIRPLVGPEVALFGQQGDDLGARMAAAVETVHRRRPGPVVLIGTDCPVLGDRHLDAVAARFAQGCDVVLGPAHDGGYYLVALARPDPRVFALPGAAWGGPQVLARTVEAVDAAGLRWGLIEPEHDLDIPADAETLLADPRLPAAIAALLEP